MRRFWRNERGQATVMTLVWIGAIGFALFAYTVSISYIRMSAQNVERTVQNAAKSAGTLGMTGPSLAVGSPELDETTVTQAVRSILADNLGLDTTTLQPEQGSPFMSAPTIDVVVSNGPFPANIPVPLAGTTLTESYPTVVVSVQGDIRNWMGHTITGTYWAAARIYEPGAPP